MPELRLHREPVRGGLQRNLALIATGIAVLVLVLVSLVPEHVPWLWPWIDLQGPAPP